MNNCEFHLRLVHKACKFRAFVRVKCLCEQLSMSCHIDIVLTVIVLKCGLESLAVAIFIPFSMVVTQFILINDSIIF